MASLDVYESPNIKMGQIAFSGIWVENYQKYHSAFVNVVQVGWNVSQFVLIDTKLWYIFEVPTAQNSQVILLFSVDSTFLLRRQQDTFPYRMDGTVISLLSFAH
jgi:hypothetical protein